MKRWISSYWVLKKNLFFAKGVLSYWKGYVSVEGKNAWMSFETAMGKEAENFEFSS